MATVRTRKRGKTWSYIFEAGQVNGKRKVVEKGGFATQKLAYNAGVEAYTDFRHGNIGITSESITLKDFMTRWLAEVVSLNAKPNTIQNYSSHFKNQIAPYLGDVKVRELTPAMLDKWLRELMKKGFSRNTLLAARKILSLALKYAVYPSQLIMSNPASYISVPKNAPKNIVKRTIITPKRFHELLEKYSFGSPMYIPLILLYYTGMRLGEVMGLSWSDVDFEAKRINLKRQLIYRRKLGYFLASLKTESSRRYIMVSEDLLKELRRWRSQQLESEKAFGGSYVCTYCLENGQIVRNSKEVPVVGERINLLCIQNDGRLVLREHVIKTLKAEGLNAHSFRHTHATQLIENGAVAKGVAERLGHANALITQNLYTHNTQKLQDETLAIFNKIMQTS